MAHLFCLLAKRSPSAVLLKSGPGRPCCTIGWNRERDTFEIGQWLGHRIAWIDLSSDGRYLIYYVNRNQWSEPNSYYQAVSRAPWLKAVTFWGSPPRCYGTWPHMGMFAREGRGPEMIYVEPHEVYPVPPEPQWDEVRLPILRKSPFPEAKSLELGYSGIRLLRDGWRPVTPAPPASPEELAVWARLPRRGVFDKIGPEGWRIRQTCWRGTLRSKGQNQNRRNGTFETFALVSPSGDVFDEPSWEWADFDDARGRVVWTRDCCLFAAKVTGGRRGDPMMLLDTREMKFERRIAPY
jgi:hypothetical protein